MDKMTLSAHRRIIGNNPFAYTKDLESDRLTGTFINHTRADFPGTKFNPEVKKVVKEIIHLIFETQDRRPFFHIEGTELPLCWNNPADWNLNYIKYQWGHLLSKNQGADIEKNIENIGLYSARCNNHIQTSMNIQELMVYGGLIAQRISNVLTKRRLLFESKEWKDLVAKLENKVNR